MKQLLPYLKTRLKSSSTFKSQNDQLVASEIYKEEDLLIFLELALSDISLAQGVLLNVEDQTTMNFYRGLLVQGAVVQALGSQALLEKGREWKFDNAEPPKVAGVLMKQYELELASYTRKLEMLKVK